MSAGRVKYALCTSAQGRTLEVGGILGDGDGLHKDFVICDAGYGVFFDSNLAALREWVSVIRLHLHEVLVREPHRRPRPSW